MGSRTISISDEAYKLLRSLKGSKDSFTDVILREVGQRPLSSFAGVFSRASAKDMTRTINDMRTRSSKRVRSTSRKLS